MSKGSTKLNKLSVRSKMNNAAYNKNAASSKYGNSKFNYKDVFKNSNSSIKINKD